MRSCISDNTLRVHWTAKLVNVVYLTNHCSL